MSSKQDPPVTSESRALNIYRIVVIVFFLSLLGGALSIAFVYESQTLWYKVGSDKVMLRGGQLCGLLALVLLFTQIILAVRNEFLTRLFGLATIMRWHRFNGLLVALFAVCHVILVLAPEGLTHIPLGKDFWPEMVGMLLLGIVLSMVISSQFRQNMGLDYRKWRAIHRILGYLASFIVVIHVYFVSDSFAHQVPATALLLTFLTVMGVVVLSKKRAGKK